MSFLVQHIRSGEYARRPQPLDLAPGQLAVNYNSDSTGLFFRTDSGELVKAGPVHVGASAPPQINWTERSIGEMWLDTTEPTEAVLKLWTENGWTPTSVGTNGINTAMIENGAVTSSKITLDGTLFPTEDSLFDLGSSTRYFSVIYSDTFNVKTSILPDADLGANLGSSSLRFANVYTGDLHLKNDRGDWTVIEEEEYLTLRNNKTGKMFKIVMEAID